MRDSGQSEHPGYVAVAVLAAFVAVGAQAQQPATPPAQFGGAPAAPSSQGGPAPAAVDPTAVLAAARQALGGDSRLAAVTSFVATGQTRQIQGANLVPIEFEISCELPNRYARRDEIPARESGPTTVGFDGSDLIQMPPPPAPPAAAAAAAAGRGSAPAGPNPRVNAAKQDFTRLTLGMFAASFPSYPLTFIYVGQAEAPQGKADVLEGKGPANFTLRFFVYRETHLPIMVTWQTQVQGKPVENRIYYADYREVDGIKLPFRLRRAVGPDTVEETTFDRFRINPKIDPRKFEVKQ